MASRTIDIKRTEERLACAPYTSKIIKAGALLADTKTLLSNWDVGVSVQENVNRLRRENVFGKASRSRVEDVLAIFRQRYLTEAPVTQALVVLVQHRFPAVSLDRILYFHAARADRLLYDIVRRVREVLEAIWKDQAESIEQEACDILGVKDMRHYFRKPGSGGFWDDHVKRYSKSRRKAPIYWLLQSSKKNYAVCLYYHRLDRDTLFKIVQPNAYLDTKIKLEKGRLDELRSRRSQIGDSGREARQLEREIDKKEEFLSELQDFEDKVRRVANLHPEPDLNDGVVLNITPLWELVPWKEAKNYWENYLAASTSGRPLVSNCGRKALFVIHSLASAAH